MSMLLKSLVSPVTSLSYFQIKLFKQYAIYGIPLEKKINIQILYEDSNAEKSSATWQYQEKRI